VKTIKRGAERIGKPGPHFPARNLVRAESENFDGSVGQDGRDKTSFKLSTTQFDRAATCSGRTLHPFADTSPGRFSVLPDFDRSRRNPRSPPARQKCFPFVTQALLNSE
jgi:hypothetical protein